MTVPVFIPQENIRAVYPIVKDSIPIRYFKDKVPLFVYEDIQEVTQEKLEAFCPKWPDSPSILDIEYYKSKIDHLKYQFS